MQYKYPVQLIFQTTPLLQFLFRMFPFTKDEPIITYRQVSKWLIYLKNFHYFTILVNHPIKLHVPDCAEKGNTVFVRKLLLIHWLFDMLRALMWWDIMCVTEHVSQVAVMFT